MKQFTSATKLLFLRILLQHINGFESFGVSNINPWEQTNDNDTNDYETLRSWECFRFFDVKIHASNLFSWNISETEFGDCTEANVSK